MEMDTSVYWISMQMSTAALQLFFLKKNDMYVYTHVCFYILLYLLLPVYIK